jgi:hypothetical protein
MNAYEIRLSDYTRFKTIQVFAKDSKEAKAIATREFPDWGVIEVTQIS